MLDFMILNFSAAAIVGTCRASEVLCAYTRGVPKETKLSKLDKKDGSYNFETLHRRIRVPDLFIATSSLNLPHAIP